MLRTEAGPKCLIPALVAVGGGLAALPAAALELGDVKVNSSLGQPLRASIAFALAPNEAIHDTCVSLQGAVPSTGMPTVGRAAISVANGVISIAGKSVVREPLLSMRVNIRCPYTPQLSRDYMLFVDPAKPAPTTVVEPAAAATVVRPAAQTTATPAPAAVSRRTVSRPANNDPIGSATRYRVQPGDSLSQIAQRIENRPVGLWAAAGAIFDANPEAFIDNDPNKLKAGSWLSIPDLGGAAPLTIAGSNVFPTNTTDLGTSQADAPQADAEAGEAYRGVDAASTTADPVLESTPPVYSPSGDSPTEASDSPVANLRPGDVIIESENPFVTTDNENVVIPDTLLEGPETTSSSPNVPVATVQQPATKSTSTNWLLWLAGSGVAVIVTLILFGRRGRDRYGSTPIGTVVAPQRRKTDTGTHRVAAVAESTIEVEELDSFDLIKDDSPTHENLALDADLVMGTGLSESSDVDVAQDFGFAATTDLDLELPEEMSSGVYDKPETDIIPPLNIDTDSILENEVLAEDEDDEYDMSVIVDATKMPLPEDVTQRDLEAIEVDTANETLISDDYTVSKEVDYEILEQDYEEELTATQILNEQISKAAEELSARMDDTEEDTSEMSLASVTAIDITAQLPANNDEISDLDDTGVNEAIPTVNMDGDEKTVDMVAEDKTVEMPSEDNTVEMPRRSGRTGK